MPKRPRLDGHSHLMSDHEWDHFWARVAWIDEDEDDEMGGGSRDSYTVYVPSPSAMPSAPRARPPVVAYKRCGVCAQCRAADCGTCKNCRDKPRFGGPGVKKKACVARACVRAQQQADEESDDQSEEDAASAHGSEPSTVHEISPAILATDGGGVVTSPQHQRPADDDAAPRDCGPPGLLPALVLPAAVLQVPAN